MVLYHSISRKWPSDKPLISSYNQIKRLRSENPMYLYRGRHSLVVIASVSQSLMCMRYRWRGFEGTNNVTFTFPLKTILLRDCFPDTNLMVAYGRFYCCTAYQNRIKVMCCYIVVTNPKTLLYVICQV